MSASHPTRRNSIKLKNSRYSRQRTGRLFFIFQIQNCNDQKSHSQKYHKFLICSHNTHHLPLGLGLGESTSPGCPGKYIMLSWGGVRCGHEKIRNEKRFLVISYKYSRRRRRKQDKMKKNPQNRIASPDRIW